MVPYSLDTVAQRRHAVEWVLNVTADTALAPGRYERQLLVRFEQGELSLDEVIGLLDAGTYYLLYRSHATARPTAAELEDMLSQARTYNAAADVTGLLLYYDGHYVQVLEGPKGVVREVCARICRDPRHAHVITISEGLGPAGFPPGAWPWATWPDLPGPACSLLPWLARPFTVYPLTTHC